MCRNRKEGHMPNNWDSKDYLCLSKLKFLSEHTWCLAVDKMVKEHMVLCTHMKLLIICLVSSELLEFAKLMKEQ